jgi:hypothetical protein
MRHGLCDYWRLCMKNIPSRISVTDLSMRINYRSRLAERSDGDPVVKCLLAGHSDFSI